MKKRVHHLVSLLLAAASTTLPAHAQAGSTCTTELQMLSEFDDGCQKGNASFCEALKETKKSIAAMGCKGSADERRQYESLARGRWSDYMLAGNYADAAKHADYWAWSLAGREGSGLEEYYRLYQACFAWGKAGDATRKLAACNRLKASRFFEMKQEDPPERQGDEVKRYFAELARPEREAQAREQQMREDKETAIRRQQVFSAVANAAQTLADQRRTNAAIDAQMKADEAKRATEQERMRRSTAAAMQPVPTAGPHDPLPAQTGSSGNTASQMRSGNARDMPQTSQGSRQQAAASSRQPSGNGGATPASLAFSQRGEYVLVAGANAFRVYVENKTNIRGSCRVNGTYEYVSDSNGQITSSTEALPIILPASGQAHADFSRGDRNVSIKEWKVSCSPL